jgi:hypothetical protein
MFIPFKADNYCFTPFKGKYFDNPDLNMICTIAFEEAFYGELIPQYIASNKCVLWPGVQKVGTADTAGAGQTTSGWTK